MLGFNRTADTTGTPQPLKPALYDPQVAPVTRGVTGGGTRPVASPPPATARETPVPPIAHDALPPGRTAPAEGAIDTRAADTPGSRLCVGVNIKLKGVDISDCDVLVIEGHVEATVHSKAMQIDKPGTLKGTALIDVAEIHGEFSGELTARTRLVVHGTGRVSGTIRYGKLVVEEGGELSGDVKRLDAAEQAAHARAPGGDARAPAGDARFALGPPPR